MDTMKNKFDILEFLKTRSLSWSAISSFAWDNSQWHSRYILGQKDETSSEMEFGKVIGEKLVSDPIFLPTVSRYPIFEQELKCKLGKIPLVGYIDTFDLKNKKFREYKTSRNKNRWTQESAEIHGQISMYALMIYLIYKIKPEDLTIHLDYIPTEQTGSFDIILANEPVQSFEVKKTMRDILEFGVYIQKTVKEMQQYVIEYEAKRI